MSEPMTRDLLDAVASRCDLTSRELRDVASECRRLAERCDAGQAGNSLGYPDCSPSVSASCLRQEAETLEWLAANRGPMMAAERAAIEAENAASHAERNLRSATLEALAVPGRRVSYRCRGADHTGTTTGRVNRELAEVRRDDGRLEWAGWGWIFTQD